jgi:hypothetical protein
MAETGESWTRGGVGPAPRSLWSVSTEGRLTHLALAWEADEVLAADDSGGLYLIDAAGRLKGLTRGLRGITALAFADDGGCAAIGYDGQKVALVDRSLSITWSVSLYDKVVGVALDPFGRHLAVALGNRDVRIYTATRRRVADFEVVRPLRFLRFSAAEPKLVGAAEDGLLAAYGIAGKPLWDQRLFATCGDMAASGDASLILLAAFAHGVQRFDGTGTNRGTFVVEGTPARLSTCYDGSRLAVATLERHVYWTDRNGNLRWGGTAPDEVVAVRSDAAGASFVVGMASGRIERLGWG